jgi:serine phosphatase RsbU (regulator of sigma subunit)
MAISVLDVNSMKMQYSGANIPLYIISDAGGAPALQEIKPERMPLGYYHSKERSFVNHELELGMGDTFYMFSDGYVDQKGGKQGKKFLSKNFKELLVKIHERTMHDQKEILEKTLSDWMGDNAQIDDLLVVGVRV